MAMTTVDPARVECAVRGVDQLGETPLWCDRERKLWWLDIERPKLQSFDPASGRYEATAFDCTYLGCQALGDDGSHLLALDLELHRRDRASGRLALLARVEQGLDNRLNDGRVDARGRFWVGTMDNQLHRPNGALYRVDPDGVVHKMLDDVIVSNGIAFSPDHRAMYFTDTRRYQSWRFDLDLDAGRLSNRRLFADHSGTKERPDGTCVDADGGVWMAFFAGRRVVRHRPDGEVDLVVPLPVTNPTCLCFGGADLKTLYITTAAKFLTPEQRAAEPLAGSLFAVHGLGQGLPEHRFRMQPTAAPTSNETESMR
ncbi:MAG: SMP-30/gluconolactonase/LRE family protein [Rubrivivax sp.]|nr:SMP-30/gluconolactonase/LRE family protein [Rubrivivax sp.]